jgi:hypothetical protein
VQEYRNTQLTLRETEAILMAIDITAIDTSDIVGFLAAATRIGEVEFSSVDSLVKGVRARAGSASLRRLNILDHGNSDGIELGTDWITITSLPIYRQLLGQLSGLFVSDGFVHLQHCDAGQNHALLCSISAIFAVPVYAGTGKHNPVYRFNLGRYDRCIPSGACESDVPRPE